MKKTLNRAVKMYSEPVLEKTLGQEHIMALSVDKDNHGNELRGLVRVVVKREGDVNISGIIDRSELYVVRSEDGLKWEQVKKLEIRGIEKVILKYKKQGSEFVGLEDPDIWTENGKKHVYFTMPFVGYNLFQGQGNGLSNLAFLVHAEGSNLDNLVATEPVLKPILKQGINGFKEVAISPVEKNQTRINLIEAETRDASVITAVKSADMGKNWEYLKIALHPKETGYEWCAEHLSPCTFLPEKFLDPGKNLLVGIVNGREKSKIINGEKIYGKFRPGLILYNPESGEIPWISKEPLFEDPDAVTITFASDFMMKDENEGILYCHVNDSFIRAYELDSGELKKYLPKN